MLARPGSRLDVARPAPGPRTGRCGPQRSPGRSRDPCRGDVVEHVRPGDLLALGRGDLHRHDAAAPRRLLGEPPLECFPRLRIQSVRGSRRCSLRPAPGAVRVADVDRDQLVLQRHDVVGRVRRLGVVPPQDSCRPRSFRRRGGVPVRVARSLPGRRGCVELQVRRTHAVGTSMRRSDRMVLISPIRAASYAVERLMPNTADLLHGHGRRSRRVRHDGHRGVIAWSAAALIGSS
jgi:hypothetical protein